VENSVCFCFETVSESIWGSAEQNRRKTQRLRVQPLTPVSIINVSLDSKRQSCKQIAKIMWGPSCLAEETGEDGVFIGIAVVGEGRRNHKSWPNSLNDGFCQTSKQWTDCVADQTHR